MDSPIASLKFELKFLIASERVDIRESDMRAIAGDHHRTHSTHKAYPYLMLGRGGFFFGVMALDGIRVL